MCRVNDRKDRDLLLNDRKDRDCFDILREMRKILRDFSFYYSLCLLSELVLS